MSRGLGDVYKRQVQALVQAPFQELQVQEQIREQKSVSGGLAALWRNVKRVEKCKTCQVVQEMRHRRGGACVPGID